MFLSKNEKKIIKLIIEQKKGNMNIKKYIEIKIMKEMKLEYINIEKANYKEEFNVNGNTYQIIEKDVVIVLTEEEHQQISI